MTLKEKVAHLNAYIFALLSASHTFNSRRINLSERGWKIGHTQDRGALGSCDPNAKTVGLSKWLLEHATCDMEEWEETVRHEVAHAYDIELRGFTKHDWKWKRVAWAIGSDGEREGSAPIPKGVAKYDLVCPNCGNHSPRHRRITTDWVCNKCRKIPGVDSKMVFTEN